MVYGVSVNHDRGVGAEQAAVIEQPLSLNLQKSFDKVAQTSLQKKVGVDEEKDSGSRMPIVRSIGMMRLRLVAVLK